MKTDRFARLSFALCCSWMLASCAGVGGARARSHYEAYDQGEGYSDRVINERLSVARFAANSSTRTQLAQLFSKFRAVEICRERGFKITRIWALQEAKYGEKAKAPVELTGIAPNPDEEKTDILSWARYLPAYDTFFSCQNAVLQPRAEIRFVPKTHNPLRVSEALSDPPTPEDLQPDDLILKVEGQKVTNLVNLEAAVAAAKDKMHVHYLVLRAGKETQLTGQSIDQTQKYEGNQREVIEAGCGVSEIGERPPCAPTQPTHAPAGT